MSEGNHREETVSLAQRRCSECGHWNDPQDERCGRCGRRVDGPSPGALARRGLETSDALPPPAPLPPKPPPEPEWKTELHRRIAGYREKRLGEPDTAEPEGAAEDEGSWVNIPQSAERRAALPEPQHGNGRAEPEPDVLPPPAGRRLPERFSGVAGRRLRSLQRLEERQAPMRLRLSAGAIDFALVGLASVLFLGVARLVDPALLRGPDSPLVGAGVSAGILLFYWVFFLRFFGSTAGMSWLGLRVLNFDCQAPDDAQRRNRTLATILSAAALGVGFLWAAADEQRLTWHDRISRTFVARRKRV